MLCIDPPCRPILTRGNYPRPQLRQTSASGEDWYKPLVIRRQAQAKDCDANPEYLDIYTSMMSPQTIHLPDGRNFSVTPVFAGFFFKANELNAHHGAFPIGWTVVLHTEDDQSDGDKSTAQDDGNDGDWPKKPYAHSFKTPSLRNDGLFISAMSNPSSTDFKPAASPTRQIAMMLWITLYWYFHQPAPPSVLHDEASAATPETGKPRGEWRINIKRDGMFRGRSLLPKLERMGLIASLDSAVGTAAEGSAEGWSRMFVSQKMFWQIPGRLFLFTLQPADRDTPSYHGSPASSRPGSPPGQGQIADIPGTPNLLMLTSLPKFPISPFHSSSHLPTYFPPAPVQYTSTGHVRHPIRPKPPCMGEVFYTRFVPSVGQYLAFRVASLSPKPVPYMGPVGPSPPPHPHLGLMSDTELLQSWLSVPRVRDFWGGYSPSFLPGALTSRHSFPVIGLWDGVPFGYFEIYWVKEDPLGRLAGAVDDWDRGFHVIVGEEWARGRVQSWLSSIVHWSLCADYRTMSVCTEPRVDNKRSVGTIYVFFSFLFSFFLPGIVPRHVFWQLVIPPLDGELWLTRLV